MNPPRNPIKIRLTPPPAKDQETPDNSPTSPPVSEAQSSEFRDDATAFSINPLPPPPAPDGNTAVFKPRRRRLKRWATHPTVILGMGLSGLILLVWNLGIRLPGKSDQMTVHARSLASLPDPDHVRTPLDPEALTALKQEVEDARSYLVQDTGDLVKLISDMERLALEEGWRAEVSLKPATPARADLPEVSVIPAEIILTNQPQPGQKSTAPAYFRLLNFLRQLKELNKKIEISDLNLKTGPTGLQSAETKLHIWTQQYHAASTAK